MNHLRRTVALTAGMMALSLGPACFGRAQEAPQEPAKSLVILDSPRETDLVWEREMNDISSILKDTVADIYDWGVAGEAPMWFRNLYESDRVQWALRMQKKYAVDGGVGISFPPRDAPVFIVDMFEKYIIRSRGYHNALPYSP